MTPPAARPYPAGHPDQTDPRSIPSRGGGWAPASGAGASGPVGDTRPRGPRGDVLDPADGAMAPRGPLSRGSGRPAAAVARVADSVATRRPKKSGSAKPRGGAKPGVAAKPGAAAKARVAEKPRPAASQAGARRRAARRLPRRVMLVGGCLIVVVIAVAAYVFLAPQPSHVVSTPSQLGAFVKEPRVDSSTARELRNNIVAGAAGEVKNVVAAVYEQTTGPGTSQGPQIVVFIGGNLSGGSASDFIGGFMTESHGSFTTIPGRLGGQAACAPGSNGGPAECAWADNDTFGVVVSATLSADGLANEMQLMRPQIEHTTR